MKSEKKKEILMWTFAVFVSIIFFALLFVAIAYFSILQSTMGSKVYTFMA